MKKKVRLLLRRFIFRLFPELKWIIKKKKNVIDSQISSLTRIHGPCSINKVKLGDYSYISQNSQIQFTSIGKFCSIGPNFFCGWGIHPTNGISTSPALYSKHKQSGYSFSRDNKIIEQKEIQIGNDVFIGMNVTILDGVKIGDGVIVGAGAVVVDDIEPYSIVGGVPAKIIKHRFDQKKIEKLKKLNWWNLTVEDYRYLSDNFFDIDMILEKYK